VFKSQLFNGESLHEWFGQLRKSATTSIQAVPKDDLLAASTDELAKQIAANLQKAVPILQKDATYTEGAVGHATGAVVTIELCTPFDGDPVFFQLSPSQSPVVQITTRIKDNELRMSYDNIGIGQVESLLGRHRQELDRISSCLDEIRASVTQFYAKDLIYHCCAEINNRRAAYAAHDALIAKVHSSIPIKRRDDGKASIIIPVARKALKVSPTIPKNAVKPEPAIDAKTYDGILDVISNMMSVVERSPSVFRTMKEEDLRTVLLVGLNGLYEGGATGETFNGVGKTDILIREKDSNVFIAECLEWKGPEYLQKKLDDQLFCYATWRDCKLATIIFNRNRDFSAVVAKMRALLEQHPLRIRTLDYPHESGGRYIFRRKDDASREFTITSLAFELPA
jgi:hypothetical protein